MTAERIEPVAITAGRGCGAGFALGALSVCSDILADWAVVAVLQFLRLDWL